MSAIELALSYDDVLLKPKYSEIDSRQEVDLTSKLSDKITLKLPFITANMDSVTGVEMAIKIAQLGGLGMLPRFDTPEVQADKVAKVKGAGVLAAASVGAKDIDLERAEMLVKAGVDVLNIDVAHGGMRKAIEMTKNLKNRYKDITLISGILATGEEAMAHLQNGADVISCGVGGGSICTTRVMTGSGLPTFQSILEIAPVARKFNKTVIPLAGIKNSGDIVKSLAAGASAIWAGSLFAGTKETPGEIIELNGNLYKRYNGSTSESEKKRQVKQSLHVCYP